MTRALNRRNFLKLGAGISAAAALGQATLLGEETNTALTFAAKKPRLKRAIMFATVPGKMSVADKFKMIRDAGFDGVEAMSGMDRDEVLHARDAAGLEIPSVCDSVHWMKTLSDPNPTARATGLEGLETALQDSKTYGGSSVLLVPAVVNKQVSYADAYTRSQAEIRKAIPLAEKLGVKIAIENVWNQFLLSPLEAARYVDELGASAVGWHFDIGNVINTGWPEQWIRILGSRIQKLHFKEFSRKKRDEEGLWKGFQVDYLEGDNDWPAIMRALDEINYRGWAIAEPAFHPPGLDDAAFVRHVREKMDQILAL
ncbi:MAG TPA: TIM barrel protein [Verrucomicrobiae bacterium]|jgi:hexulose-6-phosphate isomerase|nr:TIM barrel protein [Verrucomicrobiae bacterium]